MYPNPYVSNKQEHREAMILKHTPLIKRIVRRMAARFPESVDLDELYQAGMMGLLDAVDKFDVTKEVKFQTYAEFRIRGSILDELRSFDWIPRSVREASTQLENAYSVLTQQLGRDPEDREVAKHLEMSLKEFHEFLTKAKPIPLVSFEDMGMGDSEEEERNVFDVFENPDIKDPLEMFSLQDQQQSLVSAIQELPQQEQMILSLYYQEELNLKEIGEVLGVSESRVSQIRTKVIAKLRAKLNPPKE